MPDEKKKKCAHPSCDCMVSGHDKHCSDYCKGAGDMLEITCNCGHPECAKI